MYSQTGEAKQNDSSPNSPLLESPNCETVTSELAYKSSESFEASNSNQELPLKKRKIPLDLANDESEISRKRTLLNSTNPSNESSITEESKEWKGNYSTSTKKNEVVNFQAGEVSDSPLPEQTMTEGHSLAVIPSCQRDQLQIVAEMFGSRETGTTISQDTMEVNSVLLYQQNQLAAALQLCKSRVEVTTISQDLSGTEVSPPDGYFIFCKTFSNIESHEKLMVSNIDPTKFTVNDLIRFINTSEKQESHVTAELYTKEGIPLSADRYFRKWTLVERRIICGDLIYVIFRKKDPLEDHIPEHESLLDNGDSVVECHLMIKGSFKVNVNLENDTLLNLKQKLFLKTGVPPAVQNISHNGTELDKNECLSSFKIKHGDIIEVSLGYEQQHRKSRFGWQNNFKVSPQLSKQSDYGMNMFASSLYLVATHEHTKVATKNIVGFIRHLSCCPPLCAALDHLMQHKELIQAQKLAITEGLLWLFQRMLPAKVEGQSDNSGVEASCVLEYSNLFWAYIFSEANATYGESEKYKLIDLVCELTHARFLEPVKVPDDCSSYEKHFLLKAAEGGFQLPGCAIKQLRPWHLTRDQEMEKLLLCFSVSEMQCHVWEASPAYLNQRLPQLEGVTIQKLEDLVSAHEYLKICPPLELKTLSNSTLTLNKEGKAVVFTGPSKQGVDKITLYDPISQKDEHVGADSLAKDVLENAVLERFEIHISLSDFRKNTSKPRVQLTRPPAEAIMVLLDASFSMSFPSFLHDMTSMEAVKHLFHAFANRSMAYNFKHVVGLTVFHSEVVVVSECTELFESFKEDVDLVVAAGRTALYDALDTAASILETMALKYPQCIKRVLALTDGKDTSSRKSLIEVAVKLQEQNVIVDSVLVGHEKNLDLKAVSLATGGCSFYPSTLVEAIKLFEMETLLSLRMRVSGRKPKIVQNQVSLSYYGMKPFDTQPPHKIPKDINSSVTLPYVILRKISRNPPHIQDDPQGRTRTCRLLKEVSKYQRRPHASIRIFPCEANIGFWRILLVGPTYTPYKNGVFLLYADFPTDYPASPPVVRFITPIYHCNVNSCGRICHSIFDRNYTSDCNMIDILTCVYGLLVTPEPDDPLDSTLAEEYHSNKGLYIENATSHAQQHASKSLIQWKEEMLGDNPELNSLSPPDDLICPLTHEVFIDPVRTPYGYIYERNAIEDYLEGHQKDPLCNEPLEKGHLTEDQNMKQRVEDFRRSQEEVNDPWWEK